MPDVYTWIAWSVAILALVLGTQLFGVSGAFLIVAVALLVLTTIGLAVGGRAKRRLERRDSRFQATEEIFRDPSSGELTRVHVDPETGERRYWKS
jgi:hypothetical protein